MADMMNRYQEETAQIHAPAGLIRRTKLAMQEEEMRIRDGSVHKRPGKSEINYKKIYKWALPAAAAAVLFITFRISTQMLQSGISKSQMYTAADTPEDFVAGAAAQEEAPSGMGQQAADMGEMIAEEAAVAEMEMEDSLAGSFSAGKNADLGAAYEDMADGSAEYEYVAENGGAAYEEKAGENNYMEEAAVAEDNSKAAPEASGQYDDDQNTAKYDAGADDGTSLSIVKVTEVPGFYDDPATVRVVSHKRSFYVAKEPDDQWSAYVRVGRERYVITCGKDEASDREEFIEKAYEVLTETVAGLE